MKISTKKVVIVGTGAVGATYAYSLLNNPCIDELVLIDVDEKKAKAEVMDLNHGVRYSNKFINIKQGVYSDCKDADIVCITAGMSQQKNLTRLDFTDANTKIFKTIIEQIMSTGFNGVFLIATNPVDIMTYVTWKLSGLPAHRVIGSGTILDTSRYCYMLGKYFKINPQDINGYIIGEHGDSQVAALSSTYIAGQPILDIIQKDDSKCESDLDKIVQDVRDAANYILYGKDATYYGIGVGLLRVTRAILDNENSILPVSTFLTGEYGYDGLYIGSPSVINKNGVQRVFELNLDKKEKEKLDYSIQTLFNTIKRLKL